MRGCKILLLVLLATLLSGCWSMHLDNGSGRSHRGDYSEWHHGGIFRLVDFSRPVDLNDRCSGKEWQSVYIRKSFLNGLADVAGALFLVPLYDGWTVDVTCE